MSARIARNFSQLRRIHSASTRDRPGLIKNLSDDCILALCEIAHNVLKGTIPLNSLQYNKMRSHKKSLRTLARRRGVSKRNRKQVLCQRGGFLPALLAVGLPFLHSLISSAL